MPATYSVKCPECRATLTSRRPILGGKLLTCPKCDVMFAAPKPSDDDVIEDVEVIDDNVEVVEDVEVVDAPKRKSSRPVAGRKPKPRRSTSGDSGIEVVDDEIEVVDDEPSPRAFRSKKKNSKKIAGLLIGGICGLVLLVGGGLLLWSLISGGGGDEPTAYLPPNSAFVVSADIKALLASPLGPTATSLLSLPALPLSRVVTAAGGTPADSIERIVIGGDKGDFTLVVKTVAPIDRDKLAGAFGSPQTVNLGGQRVFRTGGGGPKAMFVPNKRVVVFSDLPDDRLTAVTKSSGTKSMLASGTKTLAAKFNTTTIWGVMGPEAFTDPSFQAGFSGALNANPAAKAIGPALQAARGFGLSINIGNDLEVRLGLECADAAAAQAVASQIQAANAKSRSDPLAKAAMMLAPSWARKLQSEMEENAQVSTEDALALMTFRLNMATVQEAISSAAGTMSGVTTAPRGPGR